MKKIIIPFILVLFTTVFYSCDNFLEEYSQNKVYAKTAADLNELLVGNCYLGGFNTYPSYSSAMSLFSSTYGPLYPMIHVMDDDAEINLGTNGNFNFSASDQSATNYLGGFYRWEEHPFMDGQGNPTEDTGWSRLYKHISILNVIIGYEDKIIEEEGDSELLQSVVGEAYFLRAFYYFILANVYGLPYSKQGADNDDCIPLKVSEYIDDHYYERDKVGVVYQQIASDLEASKIRLKGKTPKNVHHAGYEAASALLSRVYLYMEDYQKAADAAREVTTYSLQNLNAPMPEFGIQSSSCPEQIFSVGCYAIPLIYSNEDWGQQPGWWSYGVRNGFKPSSDLLTSFDSDDLRLAKYFTTSQSYGNRFPLKCSIDLQQGVNNPENISDMVSIRYSEVILNEAEALAALGNDAEARSLINRLRQNRYATGVESATNLSGDNLLQFIREERRRELCFEGHRWFDLRRYAVNERLPMQKRITHVNIVSSGDEYVTNGNYVLAPYSENRGAWVLPIPNYEIEFNNGSLTNFDRKPAELNR